MRPLFVALLVVCLPQLSHAQSLREARASLQKGNYAEAQEIYADLLKMPENRVPASLGLSRALEAEGEIDAALKTLDAALKDHATDANLLARKAELLHAQGKWDAALKSADLARKQKDDHLLARFVQAQITRDGGDWPKAAEEFRWFVRYYSKRSDDDKDITDPEELLLVGLATAEYARYYHLEDQYEDVQGLFREGAEKDKLFWQAHYECARLYFEKHNKKDAAIAMNRALVVHPRAAEVFVLKATAAFQQYEMKDAEIFATQALKINPKLIDALIVKAGVHLFSNENADAMKLLDQAKAVNPRNESVLAALAAAYHAQKKTKEFDAVVKEVESFNPKAWRFNYELAESLQGRKLFLDAEAFFRKSIDFEPKMPEGHDGLGMLYMRLGREKEARKLLADAFDADPFNVRVSNTLKVLSHLDGYKTEKTANYILRFDPKNDEVLARFMLHYLEDLHKELAKKFDYQPKEPFLIEVFNKHEMFSGRVTALPDLHTIGACTGRMMALVSTHDRSKVIGKPFNWVRVLRHEVVHLFNLDQTRFQCPHWFTEGLAVTLEGKAPPPSWNYLLARKLREKDLLNLDTVLLGFIRPRSPDQWQQAYMQSQLYIEYLVKTHGDPAIGKLLKAFADGLDTDAALEQRVGVKKADFEKGYLAFIEERVKSLPLPKDRERKEMSLKELREAHQKTPDDADICAQLAEKNYLVGNGKVALELADAALRLQANHPLAAFVKARALIAEKQQELALATLSASVEANPTETRALKLVGKLYFETKSFAAAAEAFEKGRKLEPFDPGWLVELAKVYVQTKQEEKLMDVLQSVAASDPDDLISRTKLAAFFHKAEKHAEAERYAWEVMEIDVKNVACQTILLESLKAQGKEQKRELVLKLLNGDGE